MSPIRCLLFAALSATALPAQLQGTAVVAIATGSTPATLLLDVDLQSGSLSPRPAFASQGLPPLALAVDPTDGSLLLALASGSQSRIVRLAPSGAELLLGDVPGSCRELLVDRLGRPVAITGGAQGAVFRLPRSGGQRQLLQAVPFASAAGAMTPMVSNVLLASDGSAGPPARDPALGDFDCENGGFQGGQQALVGFTPLGITGLIDLPTAVPRQLLAHDDGSFSLYSTMLPGNPLPVGSTPVLPPGGAAAMKTHDRVLGLVLGSSSSPYLRAFDPYAALGGAFAFTAAFGPLPGDPVDYALLPGAGAAVWPFGGACGSAAELHLDARSGGPPQPGNAAFALGLDQAVPLQPALLVLGLLELPPLPVANGCSLSVLPQFLALHVADAGGQAQQPLPLPNQAGLLGLVVFAQWLQLDGQLPFLTSGTVAVHVGL